MFPVILDLSALKVLVIGDGVATKRRLQLLEEAGVKDLKIYKDLPKEEEFEGVKVVFIADFDDDKSKKLFDIAKRKGALVNVEDKIDLCDFHVPAIVRRGDLLITSSTAGGSPRLAKKIKNKIESLFGEEWKERLEGLSKLRKNWKKEGASFTEVAEKTDDLIEKEGWL